MDLVDLITRSRCKTNYKNMLCFYDILGLLGYLGLMKAAALEGF